jgi:propanol-preferring alcohol dehydrogenase
LPVPVPGAGQVLIRVAACGVCRTDLHVVDGDLTEGVLPIIPGHEIVGEVVALGKGVGSIALGQRVGVPWLGHTCGSCEYCLDGRENLCDRPGFTGYTINGGYAEYAVAGAAYVFPLPPADAPHCDDVSIAPLLCAGLIGFRAYNMVRGVRRLGLYGFGAAAHIICQVAVFEGVEVYAMTRPGDEAAQRLATSLGAAWAGPSGAPLPELLDAAIIFAPVGELLPEALGAVAKGGTVVCAGIHMSPIPSFPYHLLWGERTVRSVANLTRADGEAFFALAPKIPVRTEVTPFPLDQANQALKQLREGHITGAAVLVP